MTNPNLKELIVALRNEGLPYKAIAERTRSSEQFCRTVCSRANRKKQNHPVESDGLCRFCGNPLAYTNGAKRKEFCDDKCRSDYYNSVKSQKVYVRTCEQCGTEFVSHGNPKKRYCSRECRTLAERKE